MEQNTIITNNCQTQDVRITSIKVLKRIRQSVKDIDVLAEDIKWNGLINPPTVLDNGDETFTLITGLRRLRACQLLEMEAIRVTILTAIEADDMLALEFAENEQRQDFTVAERLEYAEKIKEIERGRGRERKALYARAGYIERENQDLFHGTGPEKGMVRDVIAKKVGFSSGVQYERIAKIADVRPDLLGKIDNGEISVRQAYNEAFPATAVDGQNNSPVSTNGENVPEINTDQSNIIQFPSHIANPDNETNLSAHVSTAATSSNILQFPMMDVTMDDSRNIDAPKAELEAEAEADRQAYSLTKAYTNTIYAVIQLSTNPDAVHEWVEFAGMDRVEIESTLMDIRLGIKRLCEIEKTLSAYLGPQLLK